MPDGGSVADAIAALEADLGMSPGSLASAAVSVRGAIVQYHERLRPYVEQCQAFAHEGAPIMVPATQEALDARNATFREYAAKFAA